jgi:hypothetical protein
MAEIRDYMPCIMVVDYKGEWQLIEYAPCANDLFTYWQHDNGDGSFTKIRLRNVYVARYGSLARTGRDLALKQARNKSRMIQLGFKQVAEPRY